MSKFFAFLIIFPIVLFSAEPSVFGAGNLDSENPYGLSPSEKKIVQNSKNLKSLQKTIRVLRLKYRDLEEKLDGTRSVTQSISDKIGSIDSKIRKVKTQDANRSDTLSSLKDEVSSLKQQFDDNIIVQSQNQDKIKSVLSELSSLIDSINSSYVSKDTFDEFVKNQKSFQSKIEAKLSDLQKQTLKKSLSSKNGAQLLKEAESYFKKKSYKKAQIRYEKLVSMRYKPARSSFKLGEISYLNKSYKKAIQYYKKSISLYDSASYTPTLLYHTGISLSKLKKNREASKFFNALKTNYPKSKEARSLKK